MKKNFQKLKMTTFFCWVVTFFFFKKHFLMMLLSELSKIVFIRSKDFVNRNIFVEKNSWWNKVKFSKVKNGNFLFVDVQNFLLLIEISALPLTKKKLNCFFNIIFFFCCHVFFFKNIFWWCYCLSYKQLVSYVRKTFQTETFSSKKIFDETK